MNESDPSGSGKVPGAAGGPGADWNASMPPEAHPEEDSEANKLIWSPFYTDRFVSAVFNATRSLRVQTRKLSFLRPKSRLLQKSTNS